MKRLLGIRTTAATVGLGLIAASLGVLGAGSDGPAPVRYEVTAALELTRDGTVFACYAFLMSYPADGCGGIKVRGVDFSQISNTEGYPSGAEVSPAFRLVGTWDGQTMTLIERPQPAGNVPGLPVPCLQDPNVASRPGMTPLDRWIGDQEGSARSQGIEVLQAFSCDDTTLGLVVVVADAHAVNWLTTRYGPVKVAGWLQPLTNGPLGLSEVSPIPRH